MDSCQVKARHIIIGKNSVIKLTAMRCPVDQAATRANG